MTPRKKSQVSEGAFTPEEIADLKKAAEDATALGAPHPGVVALNPSTIPNPNRPEEDQLMEMKPVIVGPPGYGSPDPTTSMGRLVPLESHPLRDTHIAEEYAEGYGANLTPQETLAPSPGPGTGSTDDDVDATDAAQELASENSVNLSEVDGTGADGRVTVDDVKNFIAERDGE